MERDDTNSDHAEVEPEFTFESDPTPLIPEGEYQLGYLDYVTGIFFGGPKIKVRFIVLSVAHHGTELYLYFPVTELLGEPKRYGRFVPPGSSSKLYRTWANLFGKPKRGDRMSLRQFKNMVFTGGVKTVMTDNKDRPIGKANWYSKIDKLISVESADEQEG